MTRAARAPRSSSRTWPRIGPCRDPLRLWFLEYRDARGVWRRYFANRDEARAALRAEKARKV
jgi:hypothetical protein